MTGKDAAVDAQSMDNEALVSQHFDFQLLVLVDITGLIRKIGDFKNGLIFDKHTLMYQTEEDTKAAAALQAKEDQNVDIV